MTASSSGTEPSSFLSRAVGLPLEEFVALPVDARADHARGAVRDLHEFLDEGRAFGERDEPNRTRDLAVSLFKALARSGADEDAQRELAARLVTDGRLRHECSHDQNVYLGSLFTEHMTQATPDLLFLPTSDQDVTTALGWARRNGVPVTLRGAASTAMGGAVPGEAGLALDTTRLDHVQVVTRAGDNGSARRTVRFGSGARMRNLHAALAERGLALPVYPSNLGGTYAGWLATGGIGMNAYKNGRALDPVRSADLVLPGGDLVTLHKDGSIEPATAPGSTLAATAGSIGATPDAEGPASRRLTGDDAKAWLRARGIESLTLADLAGTEGQFGLIVALEVDVEPLPELAPFLLAFAKRDDAIAALTWLEGLVAKGLERPGDVKLLSPSHLEHVRHVWSEDDAREWTRLPGDLSNEKGMPWKRVLSPAELGTGDATGAAPTGATTLLLSFLSADAGRAFAADIASAPGAPALLSAEGMRLSRERFRPQQIKRLGPAMLAAEIVLPAKNVHRFLPAAERLAANAGNELDAEVYFLSDGTAMALAAYLADHRKGAFHADLVLAPALLDLAMRRYGGRPYVLGRWQAAYFPKKYDAPDRTRLTAMKVALDPDHIVNRSAFFAMGLKGPLGSLVEMSMPIGVRALRLAATLFPPITRFGHALAKKIPGPAAGRGYATHEADEKTGPRFEAQPSARAISCVNCGECNSVCPIFHESGVRLPQMLTHMGEEAHAKGADRMRDAVDASGSTLLDLCMRCGNCEEVCQAGIPHLPLYDELQKASDQARPRDRERHVLLLERLRSSTRYVERFLDIRPGGYLKRAKAALSGSARFVLLRAEDAAGPAATCIHCAACVDVCPTGANKEYQGENPRWITTAQEECIGCGTCVEVCPANLANGGQTLRVMEAPTHDWFHALQEFEAAEAEAKS